MRASVPQRSWNRLSSSEGKAAGFSEGHVQSWVGMSGLGSLRVELGTVEGGAAQARDLLNKCSWEKLQGEAVSKHVIQMA